MKYPQAGAVKTRLGRSVGMEAAANLYREFALISAQRFQRMASVDCTIYFHPAEEEERFKSWLNGGGQYLAQCGGDLGDRLYYGFKQRLTTYSRVIAVGADSPDLPLEYIQNAAEWLKSHDAVIGPAEDGGFYLLGLSRHHSRLFAGIPWSTSGVYSCTIKRMNELQLTYKTTPMWRDIDRIEDLRALNGSRDLLIQAFCARHPEYFKAE